MRNLRAYLHSRLLVWGLLLISYVVLASVLLLEDASLTILADTAVFTAACMMPLLAVDAARWLRQLRDLQRLGPSDTLADLPPVHNAQAREYLRLLTAKEHERQDAVMRAQTQAKNISDQFALWSHQMKTPLAALDLLMQVEPVDRKTARTEIASINRYVKMMLTFVKLSDVNTDLVFTKMPLKPLVTKTVRQLAPLFIGRNLTVTVNALPTVISDSQWLGFILEQLLTNAAKYTNQGGVTVGWQGDALTITDTGIGIMASDLLRLFEPGYSGYNGRATEKASGLGLYMSKTIADRMGLKLTVTSQVGQGTTVAVHFAQQQWRAE